MMGAECIKSTRENIQVVLKFRQFVVGGGRGEFGNFCFSFFFGAGGGGNSGNFFLFLGGVTWGGH